MSRNLFRILVLAMTASVGAACLAEPAFAWGPSVSAKIRVKPQVTGGHWSKGRFIPARPKTTTRQPLLQPYRNPGDGGPIRTPTRGNGQPGSNFGSGANYHGGSRSNRR